MPAITRKRTQDTHIASPHQAPLPPAAAAATAPLLSTAETTASIAAAVSAGTASRVNPDDSESDSETDEEFVDDEDHLNIQGFMRSAQRDRIKPKTRRAYEATCEEWLCGPAD